MMQGRHGRARAQPRRRHLVPGAGLPGPAVRQHQSGGRLPVRRRRTGDADRATAIGRRAAAPGAAPDHRRVGVGASLVDLVDPRPGQQLAVRADNRCHALLLLTTVAEPDPYNLLLQLQVVGQVRDFLRRGLRLLDEV